MLQVTWICFWVQGQTFIHSLAANSPDTFHPNITSTSEQKVMDMFFMWLENKNRTRAVQLKKK